MGSARPSGLRIARLWAAVKLTHPIGALSRTSKSYAAAWMAHAGRPARRTILPLRKTHALRHGGAHEAYPGVRFFDGEITPGLCWIWTGLTATQSRADCGVCDGRAAPTPPPPGARGWKAHAEPRPRACDITQSEGFQQWSRNKSRHQPHPGARSTCADPMGPRDFNAITLMQHTGLRVSELCSLDVADVS